MPSFVHFAFHQYLHLIQSLLIFTRMLDKIMQLQVFKPGDEPLIAAAVLDLFALLPQSSQFVESLVKQTVRLEMALPRYKPCLSASPFREPLAKYLNRHFASKFGLFDRFPFCQC